MGRGVVSVFTLCYSCVKTDQRREATMSEAIKPVSAAEERDRRALASAIGSVLFNAGNHPNPAAVWGRDFSELRDKLVDSVVKNGFTLGAGE